MINIYCNDKKQSIEAGSSLQDLLLQQSSLANTFAVAINQEFLPRSAYGTTKLCDNDRVDIIIPQQGG